MKQAQSGTSRYPSPGRWWAREAAASRLLASSHSRLSPEVRSPSPALARSWGRAIGNLLGAAWFLITFPFRLVFWTIAWLGRLTGVVAGFLLMVIGMALLAGPFFIIGIPLFLLGLVLTLRCLE
jgi:hypothetical protein